MNLETYLRIKTAAATEGLTEKDIKKLKEQANKGWIPDIFGGLLKGTLYGAGLGAVGGSLAGYGLSPSLYPEDTTLLGGMIGANGGMRVGGLAGALHRVLTHNSKKRRAARILKELGLDNEH